ncbi:uncharacterized protein BDV17DRAFT_286915 [Aspergillus undulatus]|uniref:uncharacterized protein n=1 Tax=Aspergillus undulatus TaxID=1810928 RepID=UPI003CCDA0D0
MNSKDLAHWAQENNSRFYELVTKDPGAPEEKLFSDHDLDGWNGTILSGSKEWLQLASYMIIGSGITACSVAHTILHDPAFGSHDVLVVEAGVLDNPRTN